MFLWLRTTGRGEVKFGWRAETCDDALSLSDNERCDNGMVIANDLKPWRWRLRWRFLEDLLVRLCEIADVYIYIYIYESL
jgi:hypothetical protein